jgi:hypothetical protein
MTTLATARKALSDARTAGTVAAWQRAAELFDLAAERKQRRPTAADVDPKNKGQTIVHTARVTFATGVSWRFSIGQHKGDTLADALDNARRFAVACWRNSNQPGPGSNGERARAFVMYAAQYHGQAKIWIDCMERAAGWRKMAVVQGCTYRQPLAAPSIGEVDYTIPHPAIIECRIVKAGAGPMTGVDLEVAPIPVAAE